MSTWEASCGDLSRVVPVERLVRMKQVAAPFCLVLETIKVRMDDLHRQQRQEPHTGGTYEHAFVFSCLQIISFIIFSFLVNLFDKILRAPTIPQRGTRGTRYVV